MMPSSPINRNRKSSPSKPGEGQTLEDQKLAMAPPAKLHIAIVVFSFGFSSRNVPQWATTETMSSPSHQRQRSMLWGPLLRMCARLRGSFHQPQSPPKPSSERNASMSNSAAICTQRTVPMAPEATRSRTVRFDSRNRW